MTKVYSSAAAVLDGLRHGGALITAGRFGQCSVFELPTADRDRSC